ncbi:WD repeat-containing protein 27 [Holothuria leucospilota]|uniref:WD repeat-containing protein 27 n=1 Tax=Holothuria leucospilota TaxID=206669 RepID=A0A9Q1CIP2_HOLLE|nr:WD repeat-containing protein 27 [Holothuria leucospilota]
MIHTKSFEGEVVSFQDSIMSAPDLQPKPIPVATSFAFGALQDSKKVWCVTMSAFQNSLEVMHINIPSKSGPETIVDKFSEQCSISDETTKAEISVIANVPLLENSILRSEMHQTSAAALLPKAKSKKPTSQKGVQNQPLTFQRKIKSSGYSSAPRTKMFSPNTSQGKTSFSKSKKSQPSSGTNHRNLLKEFPMNADPPNTLKYSLTVADQPVSISDLNFSDDGQYLACALADKSAQVMKMPLTKLGTCLTGHNASLNSVSWSHDGAWLITSSDDKTAKVWAKGDADSVLTFRHIKHNHQQEESGTAAKGGTSKKENPCFSKEIKHAQFYYVDKFIILTSGNSFYLYKYNLDTSRDEIKRYETRSRYKLVKEFSMEEANQVMCLSAANGFYSYIVICTGSDKSIELFDLNVGQRLTKIEAAHSRCVHSISQNQGSNFSSISASTYNMFATAAVTDGIKVWDVRTNRCIRKLEGHLNRAHACSTTFSPCGQYLVTGSEDKSAYVFDLREGAVIEKLMGHTDVVSCVAYHPLYAEILTGTLDGKLRLFSDR